jgi:hypothetical protein
VLNTTTGRGVIAQASADGAFQTELFPASDGDRLNIWASRGPEEGASDVACGILRFATGRVDKCL